MICCITPLLNTRNITLGVSSNYITVDHILFSVSYIVIYTGVNAWGKLHPYKNLQYSTSKTTSIDIAKYILNIIYFPLIICQISDQPLKLIIQQLRKKT
jgi:hypothetical protein